MLSEFRIAALSTVLVFGLASVLQADEKKPVTPSPEKPAKPGKDVKKGQLLETVVKSVDAAKCTITFTIKEKDQTFDVAKDARISLKGKEAGTLADVKPEMRVAVMLSEDKKTVVGIKGAATEGSKPKKADAGIEGAVKSVDAGKNTITITVGKKGTTEDRTFEIGKGAQIVLKGKEAAALTDIKPEMRVALILSEDKKSVVTIRAGTKEGKPEKGAAGVEGIVKSVDAAKQTVVATVGKKGTTEDQTFQLGKDARIVVAGKETATLDDVKPGMRAAFTLSADKKSVVALKAATKGQK